MASQTSKASPLVRASVLHAIAMYCAAKSIDLGPFLTKAGLGEPASYETMDFVPLVAIGDLLEQIAQATNDDCLGLRLAEAMPAGGTGLLGHVVMTAETPRRALSVLCLYVNVFVTDIYAGYTEFLASGLSKGSWRYPDVVPARRQLNCFTAVAVLNRLRDAMGGDWYPQLIRLEHRKPEGCPKCSGQGCGDCRQLVRRLLGDRVEFDADENSFIHATAALNKPMKFHNALAHELHCDHARRALAEMIFPFESVKRTRQAILDQLKHQSVTLQSVAASMRLSPRNLQSQLNQAGTNFETVLSDVRREIADRLLRETDMPLSEIAFDLGYADASIFTRAAKRWFQTTPRKYRLLSRRTKVAVQAKRTSVPVILKPTSET